MGSIEDRLSAIERRLALTTPNTPPEWQEPRWYESAVQLALGRLLKFGDLAFDVGANVGIISAMMGAAVGPFGHVVAFEASPRTIPQLHINLAASHARNVTIVHAAISGRSGDFIPIYYGRAPQADSIYQRGESLAPAAYVTTLTLDDYVTRLGIAPRVMKFDIEGAELAALKGCRDLLTGYHPALIVECLTDDPLGISNLLVPHGYNLCLNVNDFAPPDRSARHLANLLFMHAADERSEPWRNVRREAAAVVNASWPHTGLGELDSGLWVLRLVFSPAAYACDEPIRIDVMAGDALLARLISPASLLARMSKALPLDLPRASKVTITAEPPERMPELLPQIHLERISL